jgi:hypothetical protein
MTNDPHNDSDAGTSMIANDYLAALRSVMRPIQLSAAAAAIAAGSWSSASAGSCVPTDCMLVVTDLGTVVAGQDGLGHFGTTGADLTGASYEAVFTYDLALWEEFSNSPTTLYTLGGQDFTTRQTT